MLWSIVSKAADRSSSDKIDTQPQSEADHLLHAIKLSQCCDTFGRQIGMALEGCETVNAAKTVSGQYATVPLTRMADWIQAVGIKTGLFQQKFDKSMFKTMWYNTR